MLQNIEGTDSDSLNDIPVADFGEEIEGAFPAVQVRGLVGVGADEEGDAEGVHKAHGLLRGVVVGVAALVEPARVELADAAADPNVCGLIKKKATRLYEVSYYTVKTEKGKILDVFV